MRKITERLNNLRAANNNNEDGFTLIELMIVVVIIGILAAIAIPVFMNQQKGAIAAGVKSDVKNTHTNIATALAKSPTASVIGGGATAATYTANGDAIIVGDVTAEAVISNEGHTTIFVSGDWQSYTVRGEDLTADEQCFQIISNSGKSVQPCTPTGGNAGGGSDDEGPSFDETAIVYSGTATARTLMKPGYGILIPSVTVSVDENGAVRVIPGDLIRLTDTAFNPTEPVSGTFTLRLQIAGAPAYAQDETVQLTVANGQITSLGQVSSRFVEVAAEGGNANHGTPYVNPGTYDFTRS